MIIVFGILVGCTERDSESSLQLLIDKGKPALDSVRNEVLKSYQDTIKIDTSEIDGHDTVSVKLRHYCTYDGKINLPKQYLDIYNLAKFQTHNFVSQLEYKINSRIIFKGIITKSDFVKHLDTTFEKYGVLKHPDVSLSDGYISIEYIIGIPLAEEDQGFELEIDSTGKKITGHLD